MRRVLLPALCGALLAIPAGVALGSAVADDSKNVPVSECPDAAAAREAAGLTPVDYFADGCPDPASMKAEPEIAVLDRHEACVKYYDEDPARCPSDEEVAAAKDDTTDGGTR